MKRTRKKQTLQRNVFVDFFVVPKTGQAAMVLEQGVKFFAPAFAGEPIGRPRACLGSFPKRGEPRGFPFFDFGPPFFSMRGGERGGTA